MKNTNKKAPKKPVSTPAPEIKKPIDDYTDEEADRLDEMFARLERFGYGNDEEARKIRPLQLHSNPNTQT